MQTLNIPFHLYTILKDYNI